MGLCITNIRIFDGTPTPARAGSVRIEGERIAAIAYAPDTITPQADDTVFDGAGRTLMPGLIDCHVHLQLGSTVEAMGKPGNFPPEQLALTAAHAGRVLLDHGFTGAFSGGSSSAGAELAVKAAFDRGTLPGPRMVTSSMEKLPGGAPGLIFKFPARDTRPSDPAAVAAFVEEMAGMGLQTVKFLLNGVSAMDPGTNLTEQFHEDEIMAAGEAARRCGVELTAHCYTAASVKVAIRAGFRLIYHCNYSDAEALDMIEAAKDTLFVGLAPGIEEADHIRAPKFGVMASEGQVAEQANAVATKKAIGQELRRRGIRSLPGGDYGFPWNPIGLNARDLELFVEWFGYSPVETLHAATQLGGELMRMEIGQVKEGYLADLLLVSGDPTANISLLRDPANLAMIIKGGAFHKNTLTPAPVPAEVA
ncbi:amidohydrolase family protein [Novosphingobium sp. FSY-8]|uniref:Amidohydrolase family protein n=1 Tax=Novosphingobium ovatum TaxID=1908523 RepID=A0ABW9XHV6_9SPHN|nr:amidohydrolase family protein [Novosphingobium ovatum]NBC38144.1 amidohydrolase family protein [Novosphingobium ovatum]